MLHVLFQQQALGEGRFVRQRGSPGRYGHVVLVVEPVKGQGLSFAWEVRNDEIPSEYEESVQRGVKALFLDDGPFAGVQQGLHVRVIGGSFHETDSNEMSYFMAAASAFQDAAQRVRGSHAV